MEGFLKIGALQRSYFEESSNVGTDYYNTYEEFLNGSRGDEVLKNFKIKNPMYLMPSYGSSVNIDFEFEFTRSNNGHAVQDMSRLNRVKFGMNLNYNDINLKDANYLVQYFEDTRAGNKFMFQPNDYDNFDVQNKYKSLYSIPPYFVQEFELDSYGLKSSNNNTASLTTTFMADNFSQLNLRNIIYIESMPEAEKELINDYFFRKELEIQPSYDQAFTAKGGSRTFSEGKSLYFSEPDSEMNFNNTAGLSYKGVSDQDALKIISFFLQKQCFETVKFSTKGVRPRQMHMHCKKITHDFVFKNSNDITVTLAESTFSMDMKTTI